MLTPGPFNETAFEHAVPGLDLGYPLVEGSDLVVRGDGVWLRALGRLEPVDVILRRVDDWFCDPLELRPTRSSASPASSRPHASGAVSIVNTLGSRRAREPRAAARSCHASAEHLLGAAAAPAVRADLVVRRRRRSRRYVLAHLDELVVRPSAREPGTAVRFGWELSRAELDDLRRRIEHRPLAWVGQEPVALASAPTLTADGLEPRRTVLRTFAVARSDSYVVMPGGLTRVAPDGGTGRISNQAGAISKDTWVLASEPERLTGFWLQLGSGGGGDRPDGRDPLARGGEPLVAGPLRRARRDDHAAAAHGARPPQRVPGLDEPTPASRRCRRCSSPSRRSRRRTRASSATAPRSVSRAPPPSCCRWSSTSVGRAHSRSPCARCSTAAYAVRDQLSNDTWLVVGSLDRVILRLRSPENDRQADVQAALQRVMQSLLALGGLGDESMVRDVGWRFMDAGRRLERAIGLLSLLRATVTRRARHGDRQPRASSRS